MRILLVDDHRIFREGLWLLISREFPLATLSGEAGTAIAALELAKTMRPDLVVMDLHLPDGNGLEVSEQILSVLPQTRIIVLSAEVSLSFVKEALAVGVIGYLVKSNAPEEMTQAIRSCMDGKLYLCKEANQIALADYKHVILNPEKESHPSLSEREFEVLRMIADGMRTKEIAEKLNIGMKSVETYRHRLLEKTGCSGAADLVRYAIKEGLISP